MPEWLIEQGIGEIRAALIEGDAIIETRIDIEGVTPAGSVITARLVETGKQGRNAVARDDDGTEYLLPLGAAGVNEGAKVNIEITRTAIPGSEPWKRPLAKVTDAPRHEAPGMAGRQLTLPAPRDELGEHGWHTVIDEARSGIVRFDGGELRVSPTPAMTLIDVDGSGDAEALTVRGAAEAAKAIRRLDLGGSIGIDLPTTVSKAARQGAAAAIDTHLPQPFERTAVNGFGFVQIVRPRRRASLLELAQDHPSFEARALLRRAAFEPPGPKRLIVHPAVAAVLESRPQWLDTLAHQIGGVVSLRADATMPISGGYAETV